MNVNDPLVIKRPLPGVWTCTFGDYDLGDPVGRGDTRADAIADLINAAPDEFDEWSKAYTERVKRALGETI